MKFKIGGIHVVALYLVLGLTANAVPGTDTAELGRDPRLPLALNPRERIAAWDKVVAATDETVPNSLVKTYITSSHNAVTANLMAKIMPMVNANGKAWMPSEATELKVEDVHGSVVADWKYGKVSVQTELMPLMVGRGVAHPEGLVLYRITTDPATPIEINIGGGESMGLVWGPYAHLRSNEVNAFPQPVEMNGNIAVTQSGIEGTKVAFSASGNLNIAGSNETVSIKMDSGKGFVLVAVSETAERAVELHGTDVENAVQELKAYYRELMSSHMKTPEPQLDQAFNDVFYNLEYNWVEPYGWMECAHHWLVMWHMQATSGAEWMGQVDRSRMSNLVHMDKLMPDGAIPQLSPGGQTRRTFGGSNQFWAWQVRHFWNFTGETDFAKRGAETLERVIAHTYEEHDSDNDLLIGWGKQIGNQEDFIHTPRNGSTSSMEAVNMLRTRAELALGLGDKAGARLWNAKAESVRSRLMDELWVPELGRFAFHSDTQGNLRLDGQYHTYAYPVIFSIVDAFDGYISLRHMRDRLTGPDGEVYCSNNYPNHIVGTWGMQAGAAQQPWAAWGLSAAGLRNETYRPLKAVAGWVGEMNHRGAWPEVSRETAPGYFTPPAGLFVAAVCEALYGLRMQAPQGAVEISPSFPDAWPSASLNLPEFQVEYRNNGKRIEYALETKQKLARKLRWKLPPSKVKTVSLDGEAIDFKIEPGVGYITLVADAPASLKSQFTIDLVPVDFKLQHVNSIAEGDVFGIRAKGVEIMGVDDRCGVLGNVSFKEKDTLTATIRDDLLSPYARYGRLGQLNFSRRTFFVECRASDGITFWQPVDLAILPQAEAAPAAELEIKGTGLVQTLKIRNNSMKPLAGTAVLQAVRHDFPFKVKVDARSEKQYDIAIPANLTTLLSRGDNQASLVLPNGKQSDLALTLGDAVSEEAALAGYLNSRIVEIDLAGHPLIPDTDWKNLRNHPERHDSVTWPGGKPPMEAMAGQTSVTVDGLKGLTFNFQERQFIPVGHTLDHPELRIDLQGKPYKKLYILMFTFVDGHEIFSPVGRISLWDKFKVLKARTLYFPGDVDWADRSPLYLDHCMSTAQGNRPNRFDLLPKLAAGQADWKEGMAPDFPQAEFWASSRAHKTDVSNLNVVEIELKHPMELHRLVLEPVGPTPAFGVLSVLGEEPGDLGNLSDNRWLPPARFRPVRRLFGFETEDDLAGWMLDGDAFTVSAAFGQALSLNSLAKGESGVGTAVSPVFALLDGEDRLEVLLHGGHSQKADDGENLSVQVVDADTGKVLGQLTPDGTHILTTKYIPLQQMAGRKLRLRIRDNNASDSYAWIGVSRVGARAREQ